MQAIVSFAGDQAPRLLELPDPQPGPGEVVIEVAAAAINPVDSQVLSGWIRRAFGLPAQVGLGWDVSGVVIALGDRVDGFAVGDRVAGLHADLSAPGRAQSDRVVLPATAVAKLPDSLELVAAAAVPLNALTAAQAIDLLGPAEGRSLLVTGAAGGVGGYAIALAAAAGWRVSGLGREADREFVTGVRAPDGRAIELLTEAPATPVDAVLDAAVLQEKALPGIIDGGDLVGVVPPVPVRPERGIRVQTVAVAPDGPRLAELLARSATGELAIRVADSYPLQEAAAAYQRFAEGGLRGRLLLIP